LYFLYLHTINWNLYNTNGSWITGPVPPYLIPPYLIPPYLIPPYPPYPIPPKSNVFLALAELTEILVVRMHKPIVVAINIGSLLFYYHYY
jgi:hypothetical protein